MRPAPTVYVCELAHRCSVSCIHAVPHLPVYEEPGMCHEEFMDCGNDNETLCLCVPVHSCSDYLPQEKAVFCSALNEPELRLNPGGAR
ncbi:MAG: hypothetical protein D3906_04370 [Candidatus Electrothrix sp. AUS1_2]|nr:hypothetical protein [Candidatus Electrothrix sp. AUS1_2]